MKATRYTLETEGLTVDVTFQPEDVGPGGAPWFASLRRKLYWARASEPDAAVVALVRYLRNIADDIEQSHAATGGEE